MTVRTGNVIRVAFLLMFVAVMPAWPQEEPPVNGFLSAEQPAAQGREDELYNDGTDYMNESKWEAAQEKFAQVAGLHGKKADGALYWKAYALNKLARRREAQTTLAELRKGYPKSSWLKDAGALQVEMQQNAGQPVNVQNQVDEETKLLALNSLMNTDPQQALPILKKVLSSNNSLRLKSQALFVLAQSGSPEAQQTLLAVARGQSQPELQRKAIEYLGTEGSPQHSTALAEIFRTSTNPETKRAILNAYVTCDCRKELLEAAQAEPDPEIRRMAIQHLGAAGGRDELRQLYKSLASVEDKESVIQGFVADDDVQGLSEAARSERDPRVRASAVRSLGAVGGQQSKSTLMQMYASEKDHEVKRAIIEGLFIQDDAPDLIDLARKESDPELRRHLIQQLSVMDDPKARDYMLEILNK